MLQYSPHRGDIMGSIKLLPEQLEQIKTRVSELEHQISELRESLLKSDTQVMRYSGGEGFDGIPDLATFGQLSIAKQELVELTETLRNAEVISEYNNEQIEVGTRFVVTIKKENRASTEKLILVDGGQHILDLLSSEYKPVSIASPFGQAVRSKKQMKYSCIVHQQTKWQMV